ncbi:MAG TPA: amidohydrolase family protein, partial [Thermoanaerobaculia bacterium]|nr:amidohydrolase family protein [Thermoanaerobaculia bacterium]
MSKRIAVFLFAVLCVASVVHAAQNTLLKPERVFDGTNAAPHPGWVVLVSGDKIVSAGPASDVAVPAGTTTIDLPG